MVKKRSSGIVVFMARSKPRCDFCGEDLGRGAWIRKVDEKAQCLECADLDHLVFLPRGDTALTRRSGKNSRAKAVVVQWARARKRYERQGLLVEEEALEKAEAECKADARQREQRRIAAAIRRTELDEEYILEFGRRVVQRYSGCPPDEARRIAEHACRKFSGRVGRSEAARRFDPGAIDLAVIARIRHAHTKYDDLLAQGMFRDEARAQVLDDIEAVLGLWKRPAS